MPVELEAEESNLSTSALLTFSNRGRTSQPQASGEDKFSAALEVDPEILQVIETAVYDWRSRPWMVTATTFKPEMVQAVWRCNSKWYSLDGSSTPNLKKICDHLRQLERQLKLLNADAVAAWEELQNYWRTSQALVNPEIQKQFSQFQVVAQQVSTQSQQQLRQQHTLEAIKDLL